MKNILFLIIFAPFGVAFSFEKAIHFEKNEIGLRLKLKTWNFDLLGNFDLEAKSKELNGITWRSRKIAVALSPALGFKMYEIRKLAFRILLETQIDLEGQSHWQKEKHPSARWNSYWPALVLDIGLKSKTEITYSLERFYSGVLIEMLQFNSLNKTTFKFQSSFMPHVVLGFVF